VPSRARTAKGRGKRANDSRLEMHRVLCSDKDIYVCGMAAMARKSCRVVVRLEVNTSLFGQDLPELHKGLKFKVDVEVQAPSLPVVLRS
jgi:NAD(P)H-flavin reductase